MRKKIFAYEILACYAVGLLTFSLSSIFRDKLSDFTRGFCEGISLVFILVGFIFMCWCAIKKKNPYKI